MKSLKLFSVRAQMKVSRVVCGSVLCQGWRPVSPLTGHAASRDFFTLLCYSSVMCKRGVRIVPAYRHVAGLSELRM